MWEKIPMNDRPCVIIEERRNPPMGEQSRHYMEEEGYP
jgi:hypothetical protein